MKKNLLSTLTHPLIALTLAMPATPAFAEQAIYLHTGGVSKHFDSKRSNGQDYNENHKNIGFEYEADFTLLEEYFEESGWLQGDYYFNIVAQHMDNSIDEDSSIYGVGWKRKWNLDWDEDWKFSIGGLFGFQNGYPKLNKRSSGRYLPIALPIAELTYKRVGVYGTCVPEIYSSGFCFVGFKFKVHEF